MPTLKLTHETDPNIAINIIRSRHFRAGPILSDAGLNALIENHPKGPYYPNQATYRGAILEFEWDGPVSSAEYGLYPTLDVLYDQHPHRAFLFVGSTKYLRLVNVTFKKERPWTDKPPVLKFDLKLIFRPSRWRDYWANLQRVWISRQEKKVLDEVSDILKSRPLIKIILPEYGAYLAQVRKAFPGIE